MNIFKDKTLDDIDKKINDLTSLLSQQNKNNLTNNDNNNNNGDLLSIFTNDDKINSLLPNVTIPHDRLARYQIYDEMYSSVPLVKRMISVYISNIMIKNPVTSKTFIYKNKNKDASQDTIELQKKSKKICEQICTNFKLEETLKNMILPHSLSYGDFFVEVLDISKRLDRIDLNNANSVMMESFLDSIPKNAKLSDYYLKTAGSYLVDCVNNAAEIKTLSEQQEKDQDQDQDQFKNIILKYHKPHNIIILNTKYGTCLGYLEVLKSNDVYSATNSIVQKITNLTSNSIIKQNEKIIDKLIYYMIQHIFQSNDKDKSLVDSLDDSSIELIKRFFIEQDLDSKYKNKYNYNKLKVRFIPTDHMVHFRTKSSVEYHPFSQSIIDPLVFIGKLYMLTQLSNAISKLSRSALIRKWTIDPGTSRMTGQMINRLKRELYNTRITVNDLGSFKNMSNILSDFKDMFIVQQNGQTPVNVDIQQMGDPSIKVQDLQDLRQELISLSGIPAVYLGYQDTVELKEQLAHINVSFATEIIDMQESYINGINRLISVISKFSNLDIDPTNFIQVSLLPPMVLMVQLIESTLGSIGNIISIFQNMNINIDPFYFLEQYVQQIDWDKFKQYSDRYKVEQTIQQGQQGQQGGY